MGETRTTERIVATPIEIHAARQTILASTSLRKRAMDARKVAEEAERMAFANEGQLLGLVCSPRGVDPMRVVDFWVEGDEIVLQQSPKPQEGVEG